MCNEGKHKPATKANAVHDISLGRSDANVRGRDFIEPIKEVHTQTRTDHLYSHCTAPRDAALKSLQPCW